MAIDSIRTQIEKDKPVQPLLDRPEVVDALRHGNIYEILKMTGVNRRDIEDYLSTQSRVFQNQILQDYQVYAAEGSVPPPEMDRHFPIHSKEMHLTAEDHQLFKQDMQAVRAMGIGGARATTTSATQGAGQDVSKIAQDALNQWNDFYSQLQGKIIDAQMMQELKSKTADLEKDVQRIMALVMSGQVDPEYVLIAAAKSNMMQNGTYFSWQGKKIMQLNMEMDKASKSLLQMNPNDQGYIKELQMVQTKTQSGSQQMSLQMMDLQKFANNIATTLDWVNNAIRMFAQMRQTPTQAIAAR